MASKGPLQGKHFSYTLSVHW